MTSTFYSQNYFNKGSLVALTEEIKKTVFTGHTNCLFPFYLPRLLILKLISTEIANVVNESVKLSPKTITLACKLIQRHWIQIYGWRLIYDGIIGFIPEMQKYFIKELLIYHVTWSKEKMIIIWFMKSLLPLINLRKWITPSVQGLFVRMNTPQSSACQPGQMFNS